MKRQVLAGKNLKDGSYAVMVCWTTGLEVGDIKIYEKIDHYETIDDVRKMAEALNGLLERWGEDENDRSDKTESENKT